jgi:hypothetical protein
MLNNTTYKLKIVEIFKFEEWHFVWCFG